MTYTLGEAAKATGKSKPTISRAIKKGVITGNKDHNGVFQLDPAKVHRIWPMLQPSSNNTGTMKQSGTLTNSSALQREVEVLREIIERGDQERERLEADRNEWRQQAQKVTALIEDKRQKSGWFDKLLGR